MTAAAGPEERYPGLFILGAGYFNPEWGSYHSTAQEVVASFKKNSGRRRLEAIVDLDALLASSMSEEELENLWGYEIMGAYEPTSDGLTYRQWFTEVRRFLAD